MNRNSERGRCLEMKFFATLSSALEYSKHGMIEEWVHLFLNDEGNNIPFSDGLKLEKRYFIGPIEIPLSILSRCCGPEENMKYVIEKDGFYARVNRIYERYKRGWDMPPLIVNYNDSGFELNDGNHRYEALIKSDKARYYVIMWITGKEILDEFVQKYSQFI